MVETDPWIGHTWNVYDDTESNLSRVKKFQDAYNAVGWTIDNNCEKAQVFETLGNEILDLENAFLKGSADEKGVAEILADWLTIKNAIKAGEHFTGQPIL